MEFLKNPKARIICFCLGGLMTLTENVQIQYRIAGLVPQLLVIRTDLRCWEEPPKKMEPRGGRNV